jgi:O-antigen/teichoic acid export membrane protein
MLLISLPLAALTTLMAPIMIGILGGREFLPHGAIALQLVIWSIPFGWMNSVTNYVLISLGREKKLTLAFIIGVGFNLLMNLIFLPIFGYVAAAILTIFSELLLLAVFIYFLKNVMPKIGWIRLIKRPLAATAIMLWAIVLGAQIHLIAGLLLGLLAYPIALWALKVLDIEERQILGSLIPESLSQRWPFTTLTKVETEV